MNQEVNDAPLRVKLELIRAELFVRDGKIYRTVSSQGHGSDGEELLSNDEHDPKYAVEIAAWRLLVLLRKLCKTGRPHRMHDVPAHRACVDCGHRG